MGGTSGKMAVAFCCPMGTGVVLESSPKLELPTDSVLCVVSTVAEGLSLSSSVGVGSSTEVEGEKTLLAVPVDEREEKV